MSELFMECVEEELEPWQKQVPQVNLIDDDDDDDDEPIFVGVLTNNQNNGKNGKPNPPPPQKKCPEKPEKKPPGLQPAITPSPMMLPLGIAGNAVKTAARNLTTVAPQPVMVNSQGFIVASPRLANNNLIASLGSQYPPGTTFTLVQAGQQQLFQRVGPATVLSGAVHRPQVQQISNNIVTLSNVQTPAAYSPLSSQTQVNNSKSQVSPAVYVPVKPANNVRDQVLVKRALPLQQADDAAKKAKLDLAPTKTKVPVENGILKKKCPKCPEEFLSQETLRTHVMRCCASVEGAAPSAQDTRANKRIMLVSEFYYGRFEGDAMKAVLKTNNTFKCQSCLKVLKNNIRFMNHMKHHLELEKQSSESWESHTTCQHCYRQYMTPFQLQCHIESAHSPIESSTNCKICELAFESEQVLLEHMKDNHKPGEMPYVCQVCSFRSSFFSDVETHFRSVHENTKDLLCPFCLKVLKSGHIYMQHYMKHQKKGIHRCGKCRLNFLTCKEKLDHKTNAHRTFSKPKALEGLPPGTKVTIRASLTGKIPSAPISPDQSGIVVSPWLNQQTKHPDNMSKYKSNASGARKANAAQNKKHNLALRNLSVDGRCYICIECNSRVDHFFSHFPLVLSCGACRYRTSCKVSIGNHMIRFHSTRANIRFQKMDHRKNQSTLKLTLVCLNCDLLVDASGGDLMTKHLSDRPNHVCKVIQEKADMKDIHRGYPMGPTANIPNLLKLPTAQRHKEMDSTVAESEASQSSTLAVNESASERMLPTAEREKMSAGSCVSSSSEGQLMQPQPSALSPPCASDGLSDVGAESVGASKSLDLTEQLPVPEPAPEAEMRKQQSK
ncbi:zinc finger protein 280C [Brachionichthys hirsutus]|uniref:zinc finger protein 280C n=1 Tax=Brachionichthys hirsutus TaxID=412623 RepID=UPI00360543F7